MIENIGWDWSYCNPPEPEWIDEDKCFDFEYETIDGRKLFVEAIMRISGDFYIDRVFYQDPKYNTNRNIKALLKPETIRILEDEASDWYWNKIE